jgi:hypothetical protein
MNSRRRIVPLVVDVPQAIYYSNSREMLTGLGSKKVRQRFAAAARRRQNVTMLPSLRDSPFNAMMLRR